MPGVPVLAAADEQRLIENEERAAIGHRFSEGLEDPDGAAPYCRCDGCDERGTATAI